MRANGSVSLLETQGFNFTRNNLLKLSQENVHAELYQIKHCRSNLGEVLKDNCQHDEFKPETKQIAVIPDIQQWICLINITLVWFVRCARQNATPRQRIQVHNQLRSWKRLRNSNYVRAFILIERSQALLV